MKAKLTIKDTVVEHILSLQEVKKDYLNNLVRLALKALQKKDNYTMAHSARVKYYAMIFGQHIGLSSSELHTLELAAILHDIGKIGIPDSILKKQARLTEEEYEIIKQHSTKGEYIVSTISSLKGIDKIVRHHHERYDGNGYPDRLKGNKIPLLSRLILITDTFDAITSTRPYRTGAPFEVAASELEKFAGTQFDPDLVKAFMRTFNKSI